MSRAALQPSLADEASPVPRLGALQRWLLDVVTHPLGVSDGVLSAAESVPSLCEHDAASLIDSGRLPATERVAIYRDGYFARLSECLADDYPALRAALGADPFDALCKDFIVAHPPRSSSLNHYGAPFAAYCATRSEPWHLPSADLARLEWALVSAIHADAEQVLQADDLTQLTPDDWQRARLRPSPALHVLGLDYPVNRRYQEWARGGSSALPRRRRRNLLAVCRRDTDLWRVPIEPELEPVLSALCAGAPLPRAIASLADVPKRRSTRGAAAVDERLLARVQAALRDWMGCGFFAGME